jgi:hypothetical protein
MTQSASTVERHRLPTPKSRQSTLDEELKGMGFQHDLAIVSSKPVDPSAPATTNVKPQVPDPLLLTPPVTSTVADGDDLEEEDILRDIRNPPIPPVHPEEDDIHHHGNSQVSAAQDSQNATAGLGTSTPKATPPEFPPARRSATLTSMISLSEDTLKPYDTQGPSTPLRVQKWQSDVFAVGVQEQQKEDAVSAKMNDRIAQLQSKRIGKVMYPCDQCGRIFSSRSELR